MFFSSSRNTVDGCLPNSLAIWRIDFAALIPPGSALARRCLTPVHGPAQPGITAACRQPGETTAQHLVPIGTGGEAFSHIEGLQVPSARGAGPEPELDADDGPVTNGYSTPNDSAVVLSAAG
jgi:hypothetical protein